MQKIPGKGALGKVYIKLAPFEMTIIISLIIGMTLMIPPYAMYVYNQKKVTKTFVNLKNIGIAGVLYAVDHDDRIHFYEEVSTGHGYFVFLEPYSLTRSSMYDLVRGIDSDTYNNSLDWSRFVTISVNRNGWSNFEGLPPVYAPRQQRSISSQENISRRAAYIITVNYDSGIVTPSKGYHFATEESGCAVINNSALIGNKRFNRVYLASKYHSDRVLASFGDTHVDYTLFSKIGKVNATEDDAKDCAGYGDNNNTGRQPELNALFWGTWYDPTR